MSEWTIPCILAGCDHSVSYWQPRSVCQLAAYVLLLEMLRCSFMWMLLTTQYVSCFPLISPPLSFCVLLHNKRAVPQYLEVYCLDRRMWKKQLLICKHIFKTEQYQVRFIYCFKLCQAAWWNSTSKYLHLQDLACDLPAHTACSSLSCKYMPVVVISSCGQCSLCLFYCTSV